MSQYRLPEYALKAPGAAQLAVDDYLVEPETRWEVMDGEKVYASPAAAPHGDNHFNLDYVLRAHIAPGYVGSTDLLTRWDDDNNYATDTCVRRTGTDPSTGHRYLEELAFEVANTQPRKKLETRAQTLLARGVRRVFAIFVKADDKTGDVKEWSQAQDAFIPLALDSDIDDPCLARPLKVRAVLDAAVADNEVARALIARRNPIIEEYRDGGFSDGRKQGFDDGRKQGFDDGRKHGQAETARMERLEAIAVICDVLDIPLSAARQRTLDGADLDTLKAILQTLRRDKTWPDESPSARD